MTASLGSPLRRLEGRTLFTGSGLHGVEIEYIITTLVSHYLSHCHPTRPLPSASSKMSSIFKSKSGSSNPSSGGNASAIMSRQPVNGRRNVSSPRRSAASTPQHTDHSQPISATREPIKIDNLVELYEDYPKVLHSLEYQMDRAEQAENDRDHFANELDAEKMGREDDRKAAKAEKETSVKDKETEIRGKLQPKIDELQEKLTKTTNDLTGKLTAMTKEKDDYQQELKALKSRLQNWTDRMEKMHVERQKAEEKEQKAAEERVVRAGKLKELESEIIDGMGELITGSEETEVDTKEKVNGEKAVGEKAVGEKAVGEKAVGEKAVGEKD